MNTAPSILKQNLLALAVMLMASAPLCAPGTVIEVDDFSTDSGAWSSRDPDEMSFAISGGAMSGTFAAQDDEPFPETDAFRLSSGLLTGDLSSSGLTYWSFNFVAENILPSDLVFRINDGVNTFFKVLPVYSGLMVVTLDGAWVGGDVTTALNSVEWIDIQITRNQEAAQTYTIDNFAMNSGEAPVVTSTVPEPSAVSMLVFAAILLVVLRRSFSKSREQLT